MPWFEPESTGGRGNAATSSLTLGDIIDAPDFTFMIAGESRFGKFSFFYDALNIDLSEKGALGGPFAGVAKVDVEMQFATAALGYALHEGNGMLAQGYGGVRLVCAPAAQSQEASDLANPISSLISVPFQLNYDSNIGPVDDGDRAVLNIQTVIPISLKSGWNLMTRVILPIASQDDIFPGGRDQFGLGDTTISAFFYPVKLAFCKLIWGVDPVAVLPTATDDLLGGEKWALGPTANALTQSGPWAVGGLISHLWSFADDGKRNDNNNSFLQPFIT